MSHKIPYAGRARERADKANGKGMFEFLMACENNILAAMQGGRYCTGVSLHGVDLDDQKTVMGKLEALDYVLGYERRGATMTINWKDARIR
jgi:hypothetical protein